MVSTTVTCSMIDGTHKTCVVADSST